MGHYSPGQTTGVNLRCHPVSRDSVSWPMRRLSTGVVLMEPVEDTQEDILPVR